MPYRDFGGRYLFRRGVYFIYGIATRVSWLRRLPTLPPLRFDASIS